MSWWLANDTISSREMLVSGVLLNLIGIVGQVLWEILDHHQFKHWYDDRWELAIILFRGICLSGICYYWLRNVERYEEMMDDK